VSVSGEHFSSSCSLSPVGTKLEIVLAADFISVIKKFNFFIYVIYQNIINTISPDVSLLSLLGFECPFHPKSE
jgi:hypothetical protein